MKINNDIRVSITVNSSIFLNEGEDIVFFKTFGENREIFDRGDRFMMVKNILLNTKLL